MKMMPFRSKSRRERAMTQAEELLHRGRGASESLRHSLPEARERLDELREQARAVLHQIEDMREQAQPAIEEGKKSAIFGKKSATHGAAAVVLASQIEPDRSRGKRPPFFLALLVLGGVGYYLWKRCAGAEAHPDQPDAGPYVL